MLEEIPIHAGLGAALSGSLAIALGSLVLFEARHRVGRAPLAALMGALMAGAAILGGKAVPDPAWLAMASVWPLVALTVHVREGLHRTRVLTWGTCLATLVVAGAAAIVIGPALPLLAHGATRSLLVFVDAVAVLAAWEVLGRVLRFVPLRLSASLLLALAFDATVHATVTALLHGGFEGHVLAGLGVALFATLVQGALGAFWLLGIQGERWLRVDEDRPVLDVLSVMLGTRRYVPLRPDVVRDTSSGLYDRTFLEDRLGLELERAEHLAATVAVLLLETEEPPIEVGRAMLAGLRLTDLSCRWGPTGYLALLPGADRRTARASALRVAGGIGGRGRMGIAVYPDDGVDLGTLLDAARRRLEDIPR